MRHLLQPHRPRPEPAAPGVRSAWTRRVAGVLIVAGFALSGCGGSINASGGPVPAGPLDRVAGTLTVDADPSLSDVFDQLAAAVEQQHPNLKVRIRYTPTPADGADLVASFSRTTLDRLEQQGTVGEAAEVAQQAPVLVVAPNNPGAVDVLADLGHATVSTALCNADTSCGEATDALLADARLTPGRVHRVADSEAALAAVTGRSVDAAVVWASDVRGRSGQVAAQRGVREVAFSPDPQRNIRLIGLGSRPVLLAAAPQGNQAAATAFTTELRGAVGQRLLRADGFR